MKQASIICFGEVLWDLLPSGKVAGGAPMNVAHHAKQLGAQSIMISSVGKDSLGDDLIGFLSEKEIPTHLVQRSETLPTSVVKVHLDEKGSASYEIVEGVAWDDIQLTEAMQSAVEAADALVFGSLVTRGETSRASLQDLLQRAKLRVFDVNLRAPHYSAASIEALLQHADVVKTNDEELELLAEWFGQSGDMPSLTQYLLDQFELQKVIVTRGSNGAACRDHLGWHEHPGYPVKVKDTVGSGDSFLAGFITSMLKGDSTEDCLAFACAVGALVATHSGGTPMVSPEMVRAFQQEKEL